MVLIYSSQVELTPKNNPEICLYLFSNLNLLDPHFYRETSKDY